MPEDWGGDTVMVPVSAKQGTNLDELMDMLLLVADVQELKPTPRRRHRASLSKPNSTWAGVRLPPCWCSGAGSRSETPSGAARPTARSRPCSTSKARRSRRRPVGPGQILGFDTVPVAGDFAWWSRTSARPGTRPSSDLPPAHGATGQGRRRCDHLGRLLRPPQGRRGQGTQPGPQGRRGRLCRSA